MSMESDVRPIDLAIDKLEHALELGPDTTVTERESLLQHVLLLRRIAADVLGDGHLSPELEILLDDYRDEPLDAARRDRLFPVRVHDKARQEAEDGSAFDC